MNFNDKLASMRLDFKRYRKDWQDVMSKIPKHGDISDAEFMKRVKRNLETRARYEDRKPTPANWLEAARLTVDDALRVFDEIMSDISDWNEQ